MASIKSALKSSTNRPIKQLMTLGSECDSWLSFDVCGGMCVVPSSRLKNFRPKLYPPDGIYATHVIQHPSDSTPIHNIILRQRCVIFRHGRAQLVKKRYGSNLQHPARLIIRRCAVKQRDPKCCDTADYSRDTCCDDISAIFYQLTRKREARAGAKISPNWGAKRGFENRLNGRRAAAVKNHSTLIKKIIKGYTLLANGVFSQI